MGWLWSARRDAAQKRLEGLVRQAALAAHRDGDDVTATRLYDAALRLRRAVGRQTWRGLATADADELAAICAALVERQRP
jgi:hypothetical protein